MALPLFRLALVAGAGYFFYNRYRNRHSSTTNSSLDETLDAGVKETFPASDPVSVTAPGETAYEKKRRGELS